MTTTMPNTTPFYGLGTPFQTASGAAYRARQEQLQAETERMLHGPHLLADGHTLSVPSEWYHEEASTFWKQHGFRWNKPTKTWQRDTRRPLAGKTFTAEAWLESTRREFFQFWPMLEC